ncbi:MAG: type II toxin-antitoxin system VapB family antitoxin [Chloroflexi bacterium]|nr:type II toxin-antitoxin system VapB family antitoxin [Chloroflexota bacterium]
MRRTVVIDEKLLEEAKKELGTQGIRETIETALKEAVRKGKRERLLQAIGNMEISLTPEELERMRRDEWKE